MIDPDANEAELLRQFTVARAKSSMGYDPAHAEVIAQCQAEARREAERAIVREPELLKMFSAPTKQDVVFEQLRGVGLGKQALDAQPVMDSKGARMEWVAVRHDLDKWLEKFDTVARRLGYVKTQRR